MNIIRRIASVKSGSIMIKLPENFKNKKVEVIISPVDESKHGSKHLQDLLLEAPTLSDKELGGFNEIRDWMRKWSVKKF